MYFVAKALQLNDSSAYVAEYCIIRTMSNEKKTNITNTRITGGDKCPLKTSEVLEVGTILIYKLFLVYMGLSEEEADKHIESNI